MMYSLPVSITLYDAVYRKSFVILFGVLSFDANNIDKYL